jgi:hypothetical protein
MLPKSDLITIFTMLTISSPAFSAESSYTDPIECLLERAILQEQYGPTIYRVDKVPVTMEPNKAHHADNPQIGEKFTYCLGGKTFCLHFDYDKLERNSISLNAFVDIGVKDQSSLQFSSQAASPDFSKREVVLTLRSEFFNPSKASQETGLPYTRGSVFAFIRCRKVKPGVLNTASSWDK